MVMKVTMNGLDDSIASLSCDTDGKAMGRTNLSAIVIDSSVGGPTYWLLYQVS